MNRYSVEGKKVFLTGASGWLGSAMASALTEEGATVVSPERKDFTSAGLWRFTELNGPLDVLVNNAHPMDWATRRDMANHYEAAVDWPLWAIAASKEHLEKNGGSIINIASMYALIAPNPKLYEGTEYPQNPLDYGASKAAMLAMTRYIASFWGKFGVRCNAICPGAFPKPTVDDSFQKRLADRTVLGRVGKPDDLIGAVLYLASDASSYMTGQALVIDGGWTIT